MLASNIVATARCLGCVALFLLVAGTSRLGRGAEVLLASARPELTLNITLMSTQELAAWCAGALVAETNAIWWESHLSLRWRTIDLYDPPPEPEIAGSLKVLLMAREVPNAGGPANFPVGELVQAEGTRPLATASITGARRIVEEAQRFQLLRRPNAFEHRLGVVLGRAVAHEIGHYLLRTKTHAQKGLMRAAIDAQEFADPKSRAFRLDPAARAHMAALAARGPLVESSLSPFSYPQGR